MHQMNGGKGTAVAVLCDAAFDNERQARPESLCCHRDVIQILIIGCENDARTVRKDADISIARVESSGSEHKRSLSFSGHCRYRQSVRRRYKVAPFSFFVDDETIFLQKCQMMGDGARRADAYSSRHLPDGRAVTMILPEENEILQQFFAGGTRTGFALIYTFCHSDQLLPGDCFLSV